MRNLRRLIGLVAVATPLLLTTTFAGTYYIDYGSGSDGNLGSTKQTPWKRSPFMKGFSGSYSHKAGDRFIFKGGVVWPVGVFQMKITAGGSSDTQRDYYGIDRTWFDGSSWSRPTFDFQHTIVGPGWTLAAGVLVEGCNYVTFDGLDIANFRAPLQGNGISTWGSMSVALNNASGFTLTNCVIRDFDQPVVSGNLPYEWFGGGAIARVNNGVDNVVTHCLIHQDNVAQKSGTGTWNIPVVEFSEFRNLPQCVMSAQLVHDNVFHDIPDPKDPIAHSNVIYCNGGVTVYNNLIYDIQARAQVIYTSPGFYGPGTDLIYNNVVYNVAQPCVAIETDGLNAAGSASRIYNNTLVAPSGTGYCIRVIERANGNFSLLDCRNNHLITSGVPVSYNNPAGGGAKVNSATFVAQLVQTLKTAAAEGCTENSRYAPASALASSVKVGLDLSSVFRTDINGNPRPNAAWDIGAYQYAGTSSVPSRANTAPTISTFQSSVPDASSTDPGLQVVAVPAVTLSASIADPEGDPVTWTWECTPEGGATESNGSGSGTSASAVFSCVTPGKAYVWKLRASDGVNSTESQIAVKVLAAPATETAAGIVVEAESGSVQAPFTVSNGSISQTTQTSLAQGGRATYSFSVSTAGAYLVSASVNAPSEAANSLFLNIDSEPQDPFCTWHIPPTSGFEQRALSWQGAGTWLAPEISPKYFELSEGQHTLIVVGREAGVMIDRFTLTRLPTPPRNLRVAADF